MKKETLSKILVTAAAAAIGPAEQLYQAVAVAITKNPNLPDKVGLILGAATSISAMLAVVVFDQMGHAPEPVPVRDQTAAPGEKKKAVFSSAP